MSVLARLAVFVCTLIVGSLGAFGHMSALISLTREDTSNHLASASGGAASATREYHGITYATVDGHALQLDLFQAASATPTPVFVFVHGGSWAGGTRPQSLAELAGVLGLAEPFPMLVPGVSVVTVDYRVTNVAPAPAAVQDVRCAVGWVAAHAADYHIDPRRVVVFGRSAGGHLALMAAMAPASQEVDLPQCAPMPPVAAVLDFFGITDVKALAENLPQGDFANDWIGQGADRLELATRMSPLALVRPGLPPIFVMHGTADNTVPYAQSVRLHDALTAAGVPNQFYTVKNGVHGFDQKTSLTLWASIRDFLAAHGVLPSTSSSPTAVNAETPQ